MHQLDINLGIITAQYNFGYGKTLGTWASLLHTNYTKNTEKTRFTSYQTSNIVVSSSFYSEQRWDLSCLNWFVCSSGKTCCWLYSYQSLQNCPWKFQSLIAYLYRWYLKVFLCVQCCSMNTFHSTFYATIVHFDKTWFGSGYIFYKFHGF